MFFRHQITCFLPVVTCFFSAFVSARIAQTGYACTQLSSLQLLETAQHNILVVCGFCEPNLIIAETFWKVTECFQYTSYAIAEFVQVQQVTNHSMLGFNQHKMIKSHVVNPSVVKNQWLSTLIGFHLLRRHWWFTSSYIITYDSSNHHSVNWRLTTDIGAYHHTHVAQTCQHLSVNLSSALKQIYQTHSLSVQRVQTHIHDIHMHIHFLCQTICSHFSELQFSIILIWKTSDIVTMLEYTFLNTMEYFAHH